MRKGIVENAGRLLLHVSLATIASWIATLVVVGIIGSTLPLRYKPLMEAGGILNPLVWGAALALGFFVNRITCDHSAYWVWLPGIAWLAYAIWDSVHLYDPRWYQGCTASENVVNAFFVLNSRRCGGGESTLSGIFFTVPAANSVAYSVGAWIGLSARRRRNSADTDHKATDLRLG
jgi:hypothetical protein